MQCASDKWLDDLAEGIQIDIRISLIAPHTLINGMEIQLPMTLYRPACFLRPCHYYYIQFLFLLLPNKDIFTEKNQFEVVSFPRGFPFIHFKRFHYIAPTYKRPSTLTLCVLSFSSWLFLPKKAFQRSFKIDSCRGIISIITSRRPSTRKSSNNFIRRNKIRHQ